MLKHDEMTPVCIFALFCLIMGSELSISLFSENSNDLFCYVILPLFVKSCSRKNALCYNSSLLLILDILVFVPHDLFILTPNFRLDPFSRVSSVAIPIVISYASKFPYCITFVNLKHNCPSFSYFFSAILFFI